jgi:DNA modification methylase
MTVTLITGDNLNNLKGLATCSVQCAVTSPPYYGQRDYGVDGQIGLESTPEAYVQSLVAVFREVWRVLKDDGTLWLNLGDSYNGNKNGNRNGTYANGVENKSKVYAKSDTFTKKLWSGAKTKDLLGIPWMVAFALRADGWYLRSDIIWAKPNPMPESVKDRPTKSHEYIFLLTKSASYYYDEQAIAEAVAASTPARLMRGVSDKHKNTDGAPGQTPQTLSSPRSNYKGLKDVEQTHRNKRDVWIVSTKAYKGAHFATYPPDLIEPCILAGSRVGDVVLDPFNGAGTTAVVAVKHRRSYVGLELNPAYVKQTQLRLLDVQPNLL